MFSVPDHLENTLLGGHSSTRTTALVQLVTEIVQITNYVYLIKIEVSRLDSTLSVFIVIRTS